MIKSMFQGFFSDEAVEDIGYRSGGFAFLQYLAMLAIITVCYSLFSIVGFEAQKKDFQNLNTRFHSVLEEHELTLSVTDNKLHINGATNNEVVINTFETDADIKFIIDSRDSTTTYDDFRAICNEADDPYNTETVISYEEYLELSEEKQQDYVFGVEYTGKTLEFTEDKIATYETYMEAVSKGEQIAEQEDKSKEYLELKKEKGTLTQEEYGTRLYQLYVASYYPAFSEIEQYGVAPTIRTYYDTLWKKQDSQGNKVFEQYVILTQKFVTLSVNSDKGNNFTFSGDYTKLKGTLNGKEEASILLDAIFYSQISAIFILFFFNALRSSLVLVLLFCVLAFLWFLIAKRLKRELGSIYSENMKMIFSNLIGATGLSCIIHFILSILCSRTDAFLYSILSILVLTVIRMFSFIIKRYQQPEEMIGE